MAGESLVKVLQVAGAALGIPAAAAGTFAAYQNYFSTDVTCQKLRNNIVATMERSVAPETKRSLLRKDVNEFDKLVRRRRSGRAHHFPCGDHARTSGACGGRDRACHDGRCRPGHGRRRRAAGFVSPLAAPIGRRVRCAGRQGALWLGCAGSPAVRGLGAPFQRIHDFGHVAAAARYGLERADHASGLVGAARGDQRSDQNAEPTPERRLRACSVDARRFRPAVGRGRSGLMLVSVTAEIIHVRRPRA